MAVDFPSSPTVGQTFTSGGVTWMWDGVKWTSTSAATGLYLPLSGGTMQGDLILNRDAQVALGAATLEQVQARGSGSNRIINGDMRIDQRNNGASGTATGVYTVDRWYYPGSVASKGTWQRGTAGPIPLALGIGYYLGFVSSSAYTSAAGDVFTFQQPIEADMVTDFCWGAANAQPVTLSFWANSTLAGTFGGVICNQPGPVTRSYPFSYTLAASTWTKIVITIPGDTAGTWVMQGNASALVVVFDLGCGANYRAPAGAWASGNYRGVTGAVSVVGTNGAGFYVANVKLEIGSIATPFNRKSPQESLADCQRYYQQWNAGAICVAQAYGAGAAVGVIPLMTTMRAAPTISGTLISLNAAGSNNAAFSGGTMNGSPYEIILNVSGTTGLVAGNATELSVAAGTVLTANAEL